MVTPVWTGNVKVVTLVLVRKKAGETLADHNHKDLSKT